MTFHVIWILSDIQFLRPHCVFPDCGEENFNADERTPAQSAFVETPSGHRTNALHYGVTDGADKGGKDYEGSNPLSFAYGGFGEIKCAQVLLEAGSKFDALDVFKQQTDILEISRSDYEMDGSVNQPYMSLMGILYNRTKREKLWDKSERGGSTRGMANADDDQSILIVHTYHHLFVIDINGEQKADSGTRCNPVLLRTIDLIKGGYPLGMGILKLENKSVYMFGGSIEQSRTKSRLAYKRSRKPFFYKLNSKNWFLKLNNEVDNTKVPKVNPWVANIEDKILVLDSEYGFKGRSPRLLEFYDLRSKTWKKFPEIPTQKSLERFSCVLVGYKLYIMFGSFDRELFFCLNTRSQEWEEKSANNLYESLEMCSMFFPHNGKTISGMDGLKANQNIIICRIVNLGRIYAYLINDNGSLLCYQDLTDELCRDTNLYPYTGFLFIDLKRGGRMCMVVIDRPMEDTMGISYLEKSILLRHFELKLKKGFRVPKDVPGGPVQNEFLDVQVFKSQRVELESSVKQGFFLIDAVFL